MPCKFYIQVACKCYVQEFRKNSTQVFVQVVHKLTFYVQVACKCYVKVAYKLMFYVQVVSRKSSYVSKCNVKLSQKLHFKIKLISRNLNQFNTNLFYDLPYSYSCSHSYSCCSLNCYYDLACVQCCCWYYCSLGDCQRCQHYHCLNLSHYRHHRSSRLKILKSSVRQSMLKMQIKVISKFEMNILLSNSMKTRIDIKMQLNKGLIKKLSDRLQNYIIECNNAETMKEKWRIDVQLNRKNTYIIDYHLMWLLVLLLLILYCTRRFWQHIWCSWWSWYIITYVTIIIIYIIIFVAVIIVHGRWWWWLLNIGKIIIIQ